MSIKIVEVHRNHDLHESGLLIQNPSNFLVNISGWKICTRVWRGNEPGPPKWYVIPDGTSMSGFKKLYISGTRFNLTRSRKKCWISNTRAGNVLLWDERGGIVDSVRYSRRNARNGIKDDTTIETFYERAKLL